MGRAEEMEQRKRERAAAKRKFTRKYNLFQESVSQEDPVAILQSCYKEVQEAYSSVEDLHEKFVELRMAESDMVEAQLEDEEKYIFELEKKRNIAHSLLIKTTDSQAKQSSDTKPKVKVKALEPPKFDGNIRDYPSFKSDFKRLVNSSFGEDPYALKQCLSGEALKCVLGVENDYHEMFKRLDEKFGNDRKIVDVVVNDLKALKKITEGDNKGFVKMVERVERCYLDLKKMNLTSEISTTNMVSHIEKILPSLQKREWVILAEGLTCSDTLFPELLKFLLKEKKVIEYMDSSVRSASASDAKVAMHNVAGGSDEPSSGGESELSSAIRKIQEKQESQTQQIEKCVTNLNELAAKFNKSQEAHACRSSVPSTKCFLHETNSHDIFNCNTFKNLDVVNRIDLTKKNGICFKCLKGTHLARYCHSKQVCDIMGSDNWRCDRPHHPLLHQGNINGTMFHSSVGQQRQRALLTVSAVYCRDQPINTLWDSGSNITLITNRMASRLGLKGKDVELSMTKVGNITENYSSKEYMLPIMDREGKVWNIQAVGIDEISSNIEEVDVSKLSSLFDGISCEGMVRPSGKIDLLVGTDHCELLPRVVRVNGNLQLLENAFGFSVRGSHPFLRKEVNDVHHIHIKTHHFAGLTQVGDLMIESNSSLKSSLDHFFSIESLGTDCVPRCGGCRCGRCPIGSNNYSIK